MTTATELTGLAGELQGLDATAQAALVRRGEVTPLELVEAAIERVERLNPMLNAVVTPAFDLALAATRQVRGDPFAGVPFLLKDLAVEWAGVRFTEGSAFLGDLVSRHDQELVVRLRRAGLVPLGKTNTPSSACSPPASPPCSGRPATPGTSPGPLAAPAAGRPRRSPPAWSPWPTATTSAARSASPPPAVGCSASSPPGHVTRSAASPATSSPAWPPSTP